MKKESLFLVLLQYHPSLNDPMQATVVVSAICMVAASSGHGRGCSCGCATAAGWTGGQVQRFRCHPRPAGSL